MSIKIMATVWECDLPPTERFVLLCLADHADDIGRKCYPSIRRLVARTGFSERTIQGALKRLKAAGYLAAFPGAGDGGTTLYQINPTPAGDAPPQEMRPRRRCTTPPQEMRHTPAGDAPKPSGSVNEPSDPPLTPHSVLSTLIRPETATDFIAHRKAMKKPVTIEAARRLVAKARDHPDPDSVFDESIANGWQGIFPERKDGGRNGRKQDGSVAAMAERVGQRFAARQLDSRSSVNPSQPLLSAGPPDRG